MPDAPAPHSAPPAPVGPGGSPHSAVRFEVSALSHTGRVRESNEDAYLVFRVGRYLERIASNVPDGELPSRTEDTGTLMIVADGLGGHEAGDVASRGALATMLQLILKSPRWGLKLDDPATRETEIRELRDRTEGYLAGVHAEIQRRASENPALAGMGTTLTSVYAIGADLFVLHVGDSKAFLFHDGRLQKITHDHTVAQQYADLGVIPQDQVARHRDHHVLTRAVGGSDPEVTGDIHHLRSADGDRLLLCSDGLTDMVKESEIAEVLASRAASEDACGALVDLALEHGGRDNVTVIVTTIQFDEPGGTPGR